VDLALGGPAHQAAMPNAAVVVDMGFQSFSPATVNISAGQTVEWRNTSLITHSVTDDPQLAKTAGDAVLPAGATHPSARATSWPALLTLLWRQLPRNDRLRIVDQLLSGKHPPQPRRLVVGTGDDALAVRAECGGVDFIRPPSTSCK
jgi:hypothetical protein